MNVGSILQIATPLIKSFEGFSRVPYLDSAGIPTIGYGTTYYIDGTRVTMKDAPIDEPTAAGLLAYKLQKEFLPGLAQTFGSSDVINDNQYAALLSFEYNTGVGALRGSTLARMVNAGNFSGASLEFLKWDLAGGKVVQGLLNRRTKEQTLFNTPI